MALWQDLWLGKKKLTFYGDWRKLGGSLVTGLLGWSKPSPVIHLPVTGLPATGGWIAGRQIIHERVFEGPKIIELPFWALGFSRCWVSWEAWCPEVTMCAAFYIHPGNQAAIWMAAVQRHLHIVLSELILNHGFRRNAPDSRHLHSWPGKEVFKRSGSVNAPPMGGGSCICDCSFIGLIYYKIISK